MNWWLALLWILLSQQVFGSWFEQNPRSSLAEFCKYFLLQKYGLPSLCDGYLYSIVKMITKHAKKTPRMWLFGALTGVVAPLRCVGCWLFLLCQVRYVSYSGCHQIRRAVVQRSTALDQAHDAQVCRRNSAESKVRIQRSVCVFAAARRWTSYPWLCFPRFGTWIVHEQTALHAVEKVFLPSKAAAAFPLDTHHLNPGWYLSIRAYHIFASFCDGFE